MAMKCTAQRQIPQLTSTHSHMHEYTNVSPNYWPDSCSLCTFAVIAKAHLQQVQLAWLFFILHSTRAGSCWTTSANLHKSLLSVYSGGGKPAIEVPLDGTVYDLQTGKVRVIHLDKGTGQCIIRIHMVVIPCHAAQRGRTRQFQARWLCSNEQERNLHDVLH